MRGWLDGELLHRKNTVTQVLGNILLNIKRAPIRFKALELQEVHGTPMEDIKKFYLAQMGTQASDCVFFLSCF